MLISKGLIIADPWIGYILDGKKTWEMRSSETSLRGPFALIRKGTGAIWGIATLVDVGRALTLTEMIESFDKHRIPADLIQSGEVAKWNVPWVLADIRRLVTPIPYSHPSGAVMWVNLADEVSQAISDQLEESKNVCAPLTLSNSSIGPAGKREGIVGSDIDRKRLIAQSQLTEGNIKNNHFYLRGHINCFPSDLVGGSNKDAEASKKTAIDWGGARPAITEIDGEKQFFRGRGWVKQFFETTGARAGDWVLVEEIGPYKYKVSLKKA